MSKKRRVIIYKKRDFTRGDGGEEIYGLVDRKADALYIDTDLILDADFQGFPNPFENIIFSPKERRYLEIQDLASWCDLLCSGDKTRCMPAAIKDIQVVRASYGFECLENRAEIHESLLILNLDKMSDTCWLSQMANLDKEVARLRDNKYTLLVRKDNEQGIKTIDGKYILCYEGMEVELPLEAEVKRRRDAGANISWHVKMDWALFAYTARRIWGTRPQYLGIEGSSPTFHQVIQFERPDPDSDGIDTDGDSTTTDCGESDWWIRHS